MSTDLQQVAAPAAGASRPKSIDSLIARGLLPDWLIRQGIRSLLRARLREQGRGSEAAQARARDAFIEELKASPIAIDTDAVGNDGLLGQQGAAARAEPCKPFTPEQVFSAPHIGSPPA